MTAILLVCIQRYVALAVIGCLDRNSLVKDIGIQGERGISDRI